MFLKSIELFGFKSFAEKSRIEFSGGISALLGPNGCGKSNVVDAIKWVLGEQATRSLRAERMEDVIFNGTDNRKAVNVAEVSMTFENADGILPIDSAEISIKRRLHRSGESEYFVNNTPVKLKELRELFYDTGIGKSAYSIMEQGKIDQALSNKPEERRVIFEEAAMITKYKHRGKEAERKLERTEENMRQVESILGEVKRSYDNLKKQSDKTLKYRELRDRAFDIEVNIQLLRLRGFLDQRDQREKQLSEKSESRDKLKSHIDSMNDSLEKNMESVNEMESQLKSEQKKLYNVELEKGERENELRMLRERRSEVERKISRDKEQLEQIDRKLASLDEDIEQSEQSIAEHESRLSEIQQQVEETEGKIKSALNSISENKKEIKAAEQRIREHEQQQETLQGEIRGLTDELVEQLDEKLRATGYSASERERIEGALQEELGKLERVVNAKLQLLEDRSRVEGSQHDGELIESLGAGFGNARDHLGSIQELLSEYRQATPALLDEFLAPEGMITRKRELDEQYVEHGRSIKSEREHIDSLNEQNQELQATIDRMRSELEELRVNQARMKTQKQALQTALERSREEKEEQRRLKSETETALQSEHTRLEETDSSLASTTEKRDALVSQRAELSKEIERLEKEISSKNDYVVDEEQKLKGQMDKLGKLQADVERLQMQVAETKTEIKNIYDNFRDRHSRELSEYEDRLLEINSTQKELREQLSEVRDEERQLGSVNLMAPEEFQEIKERYDFLNGQLEDLRKARQDLLRVTEQIRNESAALFMETYEKIKKNFHTMFRRLFGGGRAEVRLLDPENVLESGIDIYARPPGKKLENIALLSGGERSLTAVALLFATYVVKPSPFCILDEIDAALDDSNVGRFVNVLSEFAEHSQFIVITHNKKTVAGVQTLLGVTMEEPGVSKIVSIRLASEEKDAVHA